MSYLNTDVPELGGYATGLVLANVELLEGRMEHLMEGVLAEIHELSEAILLDAEGDADTVLSILLSLRGQHGDSGTAPVVTKSRRILPENTAAVAGMTRHLGLYERLLLYRLLLQRIPRLIYPRQPRSDAELPSTAKGRLAYMVNAFADKAYMIFSEHVPHCRAAGFHSYVDACEEVWSGLCEYCILPMENTYDGKLVSFSRLMLKYRLQIVAVCDIKDTTGVHETTTRFALLRSAGEDWEPLPSPMILPRTPAAYLEFLHTTATPSFGEITAAAELCGLSLDRVDTLPSQELYTLWTNSGWHDATDRTPAPLLSSVWRVKEADIDTFLCYLNLEASEDPVLGIYPLL